MKTEERIFTILLLLNVLVMVVMAFSYRPGARLVPLLVGICTLILMLLISLVTIFSRFAAWYKKLEGTSFSSFTGKGKELYEIEINDDPLKKRRERSVVGWLLFLAVITYLLGFLVAIPLFLFLFLRIWGKEKWLLSVYMSGAVTGIVYLVFVYILHVPLHRGILL